ncbi:hypothetical protein ACMBCN_03570 [Candidatus Liberibacter asiaticus]|nr:hypothetical protein [Candidatus Liberibacter asiaticus]
MRNETHPNNLWYLDLGFLLLLDLSSSSFLSRIYFELYLSMIINSTCLGNSIMGVELVFPYLL